MSYYAKGKINNKKKFKKIGGILLILTGLLTLGFFFYPVISYQIFLSGSLEQAKIETPLPKHMVLKGDSGGIGSLIAQGINSLTRDYHDARNWYPEMKLTNEKSFGKTKVSEYRLSIPKLKIDEAEVSTVDYDLDRHLVQYLGTSIPGEKGTAVIFGHSTIPAWFNAKDYKTIFATLHKIKVGDEISTKVNNITYKYKIFSIVITTPEDVNILSQSYDNSYLTIVTCTPPGTIWKRLVVRAALMEVSDQT